VLPSLGATVDHELEGDVETVEGYGELSVDQVASKIVAQVLERVVLGEESRAELKEAEIPLSSASKICAAYGENLEQLTLCR